MVLRKDKINIKRQTGTAQGRRRLFREELQGTGGNKGSGVMASTTGEVGFQIKQKTTQDTSDQTRHCFHLCLQEDKQKRCSECAAVKLQCKAALSVQSN